MSVADVATAAPPELQELKAGGTKPGEMIRNLRRTMAAQSLEIQQLRDQLEEAGVAPKSK